MFEKSPLGRFEAVVAIIDLEQFTPFCSQPDNHTGLARLLNFLFRMVEESFHVAGVAAPRHFKFLGDGALYIWELRDEDKQSVARQIVLALHNAFRLFPEELRNAVDALNLRAPPQRLRVGIAAGEISELRHLNSTDAEYVGFAINLAARLQHFCPEIGFLVSATVPLSNEFIEEYSLVRARTRIIRGMRGVQEEVRYVKEDAAHLTRKERQRCFVLANE